jgi:hypothetical protein
MQGQAPAPAAQPQVDIQAEIDRRLNQRLEAVQMGQLTTRAQQAIETAKGKAEFWNDVGEGRIVNLAASLINDDKSLAPEVALQNAYDILAQRTPEISAVLKQRQDAEAAKARLASTQTAKAAAGSIRTQPGATGGTPPKDRRGALEEAWKKQVG